MKRKPYPYWIKQRYNPQLGCYYIGCGRMSKTAAMKCGRSLYGENVMLPFDNESQYRSKLEELKKRGEKVSSR